MPYIVGEAGPELFVPNVSGQIVPGHRIQTTSIGEELPLRPSSSNKAYIVQRGGDNNFVFVQNSAAWAAWVDQQQQTEFDEIDRSL
jgi:hypothetical protein